MTNKRHRGGGLSLDRGSLRQQWLRLFGEPGPHGPGLPSGTDSTLRLSVSVSLRRQQTWSTGEDAQPRPWGPARKTPVVQWRAPGDGQVVMVSGAWAAEGPCEEGDCWMEHGWFQGALGP